MLEEYGTNLSELAEEGKPDPVVGRSKQIEHVIQILCKRTKNNPFLIGKPGVDKTTIAQGIAQRIANGDVPERLAGKSQVIALDMDLLVYGTNHEEFEERVKKLKEEIKQHDDVILFIDKVDTLIETAAAKWAIDGTNILRLALAGGEFQCMGSTILEKHWKHIEEDPALERRFQLVEVPEPTVDEAVQILKGVKEQYETHHMLRHAYGALVAAARLPFQYIR
ncbi:hypothetical protein GIB67_042489 [Kingdonia uniflora]|uniref:AAA+ ATPase domain-containing protein n=1 Tax=Kingdonia uniflora TaxID=39325 RepID=A0A7J7M136_9MAGN|nr:hypothetical protein GIB67_042489 [Kingdonia uniflora]